MLPTLGVLSLLVLHQLPESSEEVLCRARGFGDQLPGKTTSLFYISPAVHTATLPLASHVPVSSGMGIVEMPVSERIRCLLSFPGMPAKE